MYWIYVRTPHQPDKRVRHFIGAKRAIAKPHEASRWKKKQQKTATAPASASSSAAIAWHNQNNVQAHVAIENVYTIHAGSNALRKFEMH